MPTSRIAPDLEMHYLMDDYTDPWRQPETVLLLHGNAESGRVWFGWVPHLVRHFRVVRPDMRGFGDSTPMSRDYSWSLDVLVEDYLSLMRTLGIERFHLVGAKLGGAFACRLACDSPSSVTNVARLPWYATKVPVVTLTSSQRVSSLTKSGNVERFWTTVTSW